MICAFFRNQSIESSPTQIFPNIHFTRKLRKNSHYYFWESNDNLTPTRSLISNKIDSHKHSNVSDVSLLKSKHCYMVTKQPMLDYQDHSNNESYSVDTSHGTDLKSLSSSASQNAFKSHVITPMTPYNIKKGYRQMLLFLRIS